MNTNRRTRLSLLASIALHAVVGAVLIFKPDLFSSLSSAPKQKLELEFVDAEKLLADLKKQAPPQTPLGQIVDQSEQALNDEVPVDSKFLSRHNQKVIRETQAALHGKFKNTDATSGEAKREPVPGKVAKSTPEAKPIEKNPPQEPAESKTDAESRETAKTEAAEELKDQIEKAAIKDSPTEPADELQDQQGGLVARHSGKPKFKDLVPSFIRTPPLEVESAQQAQGGGVGASATDDHLKNTEVGTQTLLSTREFVYFSYYNRIKDKLRQYWEPKIKEKITRILRQGRHIASNSDHITRIVITLNQKGNLQHVQILSPSGVQDLDEAAVEAFRAAAPFPNPPKGIIDSDGTVKINWDFVIEA